MATSVESIALPFMPSLSKWADRFADLPGFAYLDSGNNKYQSEMEIVTALPSKTYRLQDYSGDIETWMTGIQLTLTSAETSNAVNSNQSGDPMNACIAIGCLDYDTSASRLLATYPRSCNSMANIYHWLLVTTLNPCATQLLIHKDCQSDTRKQILARITEPPQSRVKPFELIKPFHSSITRDAYASAIKKIQEYIRAGDCYQVNFTQRFETFIKGDTWPAYREIRKSLAGGFSGFLRTDEKHSILSLSPERFLEIKGRNITTQPIKGTAPRHRDSQKDQQIANNLLHSEKDRAENVMITDLLRNDLGQFCKPGSIRVTKLCDLESYNNVHHLVSTITGQLIDEVTVGQVLIETSPGGSISGAPKRRAIEIIAELESNHRGAYCGSVFVMAGKDWLQSSIAIRTLEALDQSLFCWGGGGITADSKWEDEYQETLDKVGPIMRALESAFQ